MLNFTDLASVPSHPLTPFTDRLRLALFSSAHRIGPALLPGLVRRTRPGSAGRSAAAPGAVHPVDAGDPPVQALHRIPAVPGRGRVLPDLRAGRRPAAFARRARAPPCGTRRIADLEVHAPAVRGPAHRRPGVCQPVRLRAGGHARAAWPADLRSHQRRHRRPRRGTRPPGATGVRQRHQGRAGPAAVGGRPGHRPGCRPPGPRADPAEHPQRPDGPARSHPPPAAPRPSLQLPDRQGTPPHRRGVLPEPDRREPAWRT